jgi:hypothetical protein
MRPQFGQEQDADGFIDEIESAAPNRLALSIGILNQLVDRKPAFRIELHPDQLKLMPQKEAQNLLAVVSALSE